ncbi:MAG TPA: DUF2975 domain-containing protein [Gammaproteobacteria bacterium]|jgi:hypothetical protein|nr:DUF2975 domain-containing protein [Gammaproteobacteria bacterium]
MRKIKNVSLFFKILFQIIFILLPVSLIVSWIYAPNEFVTLVGFIKLNAIPVNYAGMHTYTNPGLEFLPSTQGVTDKAILHTLTLGDKVIGCLVSFIPLIINMYIVYALIQLFKLYEKGEIFTLKHIQWIRHIAYALLIGQIIQPFYQFAMGIVLTHNNPPHHRYASITLDQTNIGILLTALLIILISWIMAEGYQMRQEQQLTI